MAELRCTLETAAKAAEEGMITTPFVAAYIDKIYATAHSPTEIHFSIKLSTGRTAEKWLLKIGRIAKSRMGHTNKKMKSTRTMTFDRTIRISVGHKVAFTYEFSLAV